MVHFYTVLVHFAKKIKRIGGIKKANLLSGIKNIYNIF